MFFRCLLLSIFLHGLFLLLFFNSYDFSGKSQKIESDVIVSIIASPTTKVNTSLLKNDDTQHANNLKTDSTSSTNVGTLDSNINIDGNTVSSEYITSVVSKIQQNKYYPIMAKKLKITGIVKLQFTVSSGGLILNDVVALQSSGNQELDNAAIKAVKMSAPFNSFPTEVMQKEINFLVDISYVL